MGKEEIKQKLKTNLEKIPGIKNVKLYNGNFKGNNKKQAYLEFNLTNKDYEQNVSRLYCRISEKIRKNFPEVSIDYINPNFNNNPSNLRRITINLKNEQKKPYEKEELVYQIANEFNHIIKSYLLRKT